MTSLGFALSSEEHRPLDLVQFAVAAEKAGFEFTLISDHYHPWVTNQGQSPFIWTVLGGIATSTKDLRVGTGVTCPIIRYHPVLVAQMAATAAAMMEGRFFLGVGSGENLNEHVYGDHFPVAEDRQEMMVEALDIIRLLWDGDWVNQQGQYYAVEEAKLFTLPETLPPIYMAAGGPRAAGVAGEISDGLIAVAPDPDLVKSFQEVAGKKKPRYGQVTVCFARDEAKAIETAHRYWPISGLKGDAKWDIRSTRLFDGLAEGVSPEQVAQKIVCGPDPGKHLEAIQRFVDAGFDHVYVHQVGPEQEGFFRFYRDEIMPAIRDGKRGMRRSA